MVMQQDSSHPTGVAVVSGPDRTPEVVNARERKADAALALRIAGMDWPDIAENMGYPTGRAALVAVELSLKRNLDTMDKDKLRQVAQGRLDSLLRSVWTKAHTPTDPEHLAAVGKARDIIDRGIRLMGLDAPTELMITSPTQEQLDAFVAKVISTQVPDVQEADIFEVEVVEDEADAV